MKLSNIAQVFRKIENTASRNDKTAIFKQMLGSIDDH